MKSFIALLVLENASITLNRRIKGRIFQASVTQHESDVDS